MTAARPRRRGGLVAAAGVVALLALGVGIAWWWQARPGGGSVGRVAVARIERADGPIHLEGDEAPSIGAHAGEEVIAGAWLRSGGEGVGALGRASLRLTTGTTLRVDAGTRVRLVSASALELERGTIYLDTGTATAPSDPLEVRTPLGIARDVGTQFELRLSGGEDATLRVQVRRGAVDLERRGHTYRAGVGDELVVRADEPVEQGEVSPYGATWEWVVMAAPPFELEGRTLAEFLDWVSRETGWRILYEDDALEAAANGIVLHGSIADLRPDEAPFTVLPGVSLEAELGGGVLLVRRQPGDS